MEFDPMNPDRTRPGGGGIGQPIAISLDRVADIANEVQQLVKAGRESSAWELIRYLHPADMGSVVASLPRGSREAMVRVMSPETVAWMLRQMNPVEAGRVGTRLGVKVLSLVFGQLHPSQALSTLRRLPFLRPHDVAESLDQPLDDEDALAHGPDTAGSLMVAELPIVDAGALVQSARQNLGGLAETRDKLTHVYVVEWRRTGRTGRHGGPRARRRLDPHT